MSIDRLVLLQRDFSQAVHGSSGVPLPAAPPVPPAPAAPCDPAFPPLPGPFPPLPSVVPPVPSAIPPCPPVDDAWMATSRAPSAWPASLFKETMGPGPPVVTGAILSVLVQDAKTTAIAVPINKPKQSCRIDEHPSTMGRSVTTTPSRRT